jgi:uncharacterized protein (TIGR02145 family)
MKTIVGVGCTLLLIWILYQINVISGIENNLEKLEKNIEILTMKSKSQVPGSFYVLKIGGNTIGPILLTDIPKHLLDVDNTLVWDNEKLIWKHIFLVDEIVKFCQIKKYPLNWSPRNLDVDKFRNGDTIPEARTLEEWKLAEKNGKPAWCYYNNNPENGKLFGKLYNWFAVNDPRGLAPKGWRIPTDQDWTELEDLLGEDPGKILKSDFYWGNYEDGEGKTHNGNGTDLIEFNALPGGCRNSDGSFGNISYDAFFWSATEIDNPTGRSLNIVGGLWRGGSYKSVGASVRCIRD